MSRLRHFVTLSDWKTSEVAGLIERAAMLKRTPIPAKAPLRGRVLGMLFQKPSTRTRVSFETGMAQLGGTALFIDAADVQLGVREPVRDVARVLSRYVDGIVARTSAHNTLVDIAKYATVPVINGLTERTHPCQVLGDLLTMRERCGQLKGLRVSYIGDGNNVLHALLEGCALMGVHVTYAIPAGCALKPSQMRDAQRIAKRTRAQLRRAEHPRAAVQDAQVIYTDVWTSMGHEREADRRRKAFQGFTVTQALVKRAARQCIVMHCLPAHRGEEITNSVIEGAQSAIFDQAENRLHAQKALLLKLIS
jgi:ornithine carbamoyltransferase